MGWDPVPWMIGGGAEHSTNVARTVANAAYGGVEGITKPGDLDVQATETPSGAVRIAPGTCAILNRSTGISDEMYVGRLLTTDVVSIPSTGVGETASYLILARVENPHLDGEPWNAPADVRTGPYIFSRAIRLDTADAGVTSVAELGEAWSAIALAKVTLPPNTSVVTQAMITDLRQLAKTNSVRESRIIQTAATKQTLSNTADWRNWPDEAAMLALSIPPWATHAMMRAIISGVGFGASGSNGGAGWNATAQLRVHLGDDGGPAVVINASNEGGVDRTTTMVGANAMPIPATLRGKTSNFRVEGKKTSGTTDFFVDDKTLISFDIEFVQRPERATAERLAATSSGSVD